MAFDVSHPQIQDVVRRALEEDIGTGDITTFFTVPADAKAVGRMVAKQDLTLAGIELIPIIFDAIAPRKCEIELLHQSGARLKKGDPIAVVSGPARVLLTGERTALNFVQRLSGVATAASAYAQLMEGTHCKILDTRKTTPGLRRLEKQAAAAGGATNHRQGLYDAVLIKNNHITAAGSVRAALEKTRDAGVPVEIEVRTLAELDEALANGAAHLLLDNLTPAEAREWITHIRSTKDSVTIELSGGITLENARAYAETGADFLSSGSITHSAPAVDINFGLTMS
ncbi:MAG: carboxylating nicotinate-nucleotide diphosphorylase [Bryobacteraceae bacterium]